MVRGLDEGVEYECCVLANNAIGWSRASPASAPLHHGALRLKTRPAPPEKPTLEESAGGMQVRFDVPHACPSVTSFSVRMRVVGSKVWLSFDAQSGILVLDSSCTDLAMANDVCVRGLEDGVQYESAVCVKNAEGWSDLSATSAPLHLGQLRPKCKPPAPDSPALEHSASGLTVCIVLPEMQATS